MSQKAFDKINKDIVENKAAFDRLLGKRRKLMEALVKDLTPKESFDMRLEQLLLEQPKWSSDGRTDGGDDDDDGILIEDCNYWKEGNALGRLNDPRYQLHMEDIDPRDVDSYKFVAGIKLELNDK